MRFGNDTLYLDNDTMTRDGLTTITETFPQQIKGPNGLQITWSHTNLMRLCPEASLQQLKALMILWLANNPMAQRYKKKFLIQYD